MRILWIEHRTSRFQLTEVILQSGALPTELNPQFVRDAGAADDSYYYI